MLLDNRYELNPATDLIGQGGFAKVYKAKDTKFNISVAIKHFIGSKGNTGSVTREIKKCIHFNHPNIIRFFDCFETRHTNSLGEIIIEEYGVMEYANAGNLGDITSGKRKISTEQFKDLVLGILDGLAYLHSRSPVIIHRDLKSSNILLHEENGNLIPKICDFGISKELQGTISQTATAALGTIDYMSPEQIEGKAPTPATDFWALGCIVYEFFNGQPPFGKVTQVASTQQVYWKVMNGKLDDAGMKKVPEPFRALVKGCLVVDAGKRMRSADEGKESLQGKEEGFGKKRSEIQEMLWRPIFLICGALILFGIYSLSTDNLLSMLFIKRESKPAVYDAITLKNDTLVANADMEANRTPELEIEKPPIKEIVSIKVDELSAIDKRLLGKHLFSCHWISWDTFGYAVINKDPDGGYNLQANQTVGVKYFKMDGEIFPKTEFEFDFVGKIVTNIHDSIGYCEEFGKYSFFRYYDHQRYWRMQEGYMGESLVCNPNYGTYIDIFFK